jgi:hypothetical protein
VGHYADGRVSALGRANQRRRPARHPDNFNRGETDGYFKKKADEGMFGKFGHVREPAPIDNQLIVRMNAWLASMPPR